MQKIKNILSEQEAYNKMSARCALSEVAPQDASRKMREWGLSEQQIATVMQQLIKENFVNEERYAHAFTQDKFKFSGWGRQKIAIALKQKGISQTLIQQSLNEISTDDYQRLLLQLLTEKSHHIQAKNDYERRGKLLRFSLSRGFEQELVFKMLDKLPDIP